MDIYSEMEAKYLADVIRKKIERNKSMPTTELAGIFNKGVRTLETLLNDLLLTKAWQKIKDHYKEPK
jgi:hypothetical protein